MKQKNKELNVLSLFSGIGGLDLGFEKAGFNIVAAVEWDQDCCDTLRENKAQFFSKETRILQADITRVKPQDIFEGRVDFFIGGPPCQTFSAIGRRAGGASGRLDDRGNLFKHYCRLLKHYKPQGFMFENVRGILSSNKGQDWKDVLKEFSSLGYILKFRVLDTAGYGAAQHRERVILVGYRRGHEFFFPRPTYGPDSLDRKSYVGAAEILKGVDHTEDPSLLYNRDGKYDDLLREIPPGTNYLYFTEEMGHPQPKFAWRSKFSDFLYKAHPKLPVKTIVASMGRYSGPFHWDGRKFSIGEFLRLQGFPDGYSLSGGRTSKIKQIGNSVVPLFSYPLAQAVKKTVFKDSKIRIETISDLDVLTIDRRKTAKAKGTRNSRIANISLNLVPIPRSKTEQSSILVIDDPILGKNNHRMRLVTKGDILDLYLKKEIGEFIDEGFNCPVNIELSISSSAFGPIKKLKLRSDFYDPDRPYILWDAVNIAIKNISPFPSVHELYGHFTEPNPKFTVDLFKIPNKNNSVSKLLNWMSDFRNTSETKPLSVLEKMGFDISNERALLEKLRSIRIDIRTNLTNKRIKTGEFRVCYPYTLPIDRRTFVTIRK